MPPKRQSRVIDVRVNDRLWPILPVHAGAEFDGYLKTAGMFYMGLVDAVRLQLRSLGMLDIDPEVATQKAAWEIQQQLAKGRLHLERINWQKHVDEIRESERRGIRQVVTMPVVEQPNANRLQSTSPVLRSRQARLQRRRERSAG